MFVSLESRQKGSPEEIIAFPVIPSICLFQQFVTQAEGETFFVPGSFWVPSLSTPRDKRLAVQPWLAGGLLKRDSYLTGKDLGELWMFQNTEFYRSRGPRFPSSLE